MDEWTRIIVVTYDGHGNMVIGRTLQYINDVLTYFHFRGLVGVAAYDSKISSFERRPQEGLKLKLKSQL